MGILLDHNGDPILDSDGDWILTEGDAAVLPVQTVSISVTGAAGEMARTRQLYAVAGALGVTGVQAALNPGRTFNAETGSFMITGGADTSFRRGASMVASSDAAMLSGGAATLSMVRTTPFDLGSILLSGVDVSIGVRRTLSADPVPITLTGADATLSRSAGSALSVWAAPGSFTVTGNDARLVVQALGLEADAGAYTTTGSPSFGYFGRGAIAGPGAIMLTGGAATVSPAWVLNADAGGVVVTGSPAATFISVSILLEADRGDVMLSGASAETMLVRGLLAEDGVMALTGAQVEFGRSGGVYDEAIAFTHKQKTTAFVKPPVSRTFERQQTTTSFMDREE